MRHDDGAYKYGYDSGDGIAATQTSSAGNQVEGFYSFPNAEGQLVKVKYTAGVQGFVPETTQPKPLSQSYQQHSHQAQSNAQSNVQSNSWNSQNQQQVQVSHPSSIIQTPSVARFQHDSNDNSDASYQLSYNTGEHAREENSDAAGNVQGKYSYVDEAGQHDLSYIAGPEIGFKVTGGSLAVANGLSNGAAVSKTSFNQASSNNFNANSATQSWKPSNIPSVQQPWKSSDVPIVQPSADGSYSFSYNTGDQSRSESSDKSGKVEGRYSYSDAAGQHDLSYVAGGEAGFVVTGGSLSQPNGLVGKSEVNTGSQHNSWTQSPIQAGTAQSFKGFTEPIVINQDGSAYSFSYNTDSQSRQESGDASGRVKGSFTVQTDGGHQQLNYETGGVSTRNLETRWDAPAAEVASSLSSYDHSTSHVGRAGPVNPQGTGRLRPYNTHKSLHPSFTVITPSNQKSLEYGPKNAIILTYLPPQHPDKYGYIYDTQN